MIAGRFLAFVACLGCGAAASAPASVVEVKRQDLIVEVEVTGALKAMDSDDIGPPVIPRFWDFKVTRLAPEGAQVKAGDEVVAFDATELEKRLRDHENEVAALEEELAKGRAEAALAALDDRLEREQKAAEGRKAVLKADKPPDLTAELQLRTQALDRDLSRREIELQQVKEQSKRRRERADLGNLRNRLTRAQADVTQMKQAIASLSVKARRPGTVVYTQNWRGEKKKIGDQLYPGESAIEVALLDRMGAEGQVDEVDASKVRIGQKVGLRLESNPDLEHVGVVTDIATLVRTESPESRIKIAQMAIKLEKTDPAMRPGMRVRGRIQVQRIPSVLQVPISALRLGEQGPAVLRVNAGELAPVLVKLGRRSRDAVEIVDGLRAGDRVALRAAAEGPRPGPMGAAR